MVVVSMRLSVVTRDALLCVAISIASVLAVGCDEGIDLGDDASLHSATLEVTNDVGALASLAFDVAYRGFACEFVFVDEVPDCDTLVDGAFAVFTRQSSQRIGVGLSSFTGFATPSMVASCRLRCATSPPLEDLAVTLREAVGIDGEPPSEAPTVEVTALSEEPTATTTTTDDAGTTSTFAD